jgi:ATP-binding cassette subfamily B protein
MVSAWAKYRTLWDAMKGQRARYIVAIGLMVAATQINYLVPLVIRATIDSAIDARPLAAPEFIQRLVDGLGGMSLVARNLWLAGLVMALMSLVSGTCSYLRGRFVSIASETAARRLRDRLYDHLQHLPAAYHDKADVGDLIQRCTSDVETIRGFMAGQIIDIGRALVMLATVVPIMILMDPAMAALALVVMPVVMVFSLVFFRRVRGAFKKADEAEGAMTTQLQENLTGIRVVRAFARQPFEIEKFAERNARFRDLQMRLIRLMAIYWSSTDLLSMLQAGIVTMAGAYWISTGRLTVGTAFAFIAYVGMFLWPVRQMGRILTEVGKTMVSLGRLDDILSVRREDGSLGAEGMESLTVIPSERSEPTPPAVAGYVARAGGSRNLAVGNAELPISQRDPSTSLGVPASRDLPVAAPQGRIVVSGLSFSHDGQVQALRDVSLAVEPGQTLAILGPSGSGKSTLVHILLRLYDYTSGSIRIDGRELGEMDRKAARGLFGVVMQEPFLYSKTVRDNIRLGRTDAEDEDVRKAAMLACIHDSIVEFEKGYDTVVGERGVTLSGGQQQRMALARAILRDPPILILDDALSAVDTETEAMILAALRQRHRRRTTLVIAHRLSTLRAADQIVVLDGGRIVQAGTHERLVGEAGLYRRLWEIQGAARESLDQELRAEGR